MITTRQCAGIIGALASFLMIAARGYAAEMVEYNSRVWQLSDGMPNIIVQAIAQSQEGYLWIGTYRGLSRFDGVKFTTFDGPVASELKTASINTLAVTKNGCLWVGTAREGIFRYHHGVFSRFPMPSQLVGTPVLQFFENTDGKLWIGTRDGLYWHDGTESTNLHLVKEVPQLTVRSMARNGPGTFWLGTSAGLILYGETILAHHTQTNKPNANALRSNVLRAVCRAKDGSVWFSSNTGLSQLKDGKFAHFGKEHGLKDTTIAAIHQDRQGTIWIGSYGGLARIENGQIVTELTATGLPYDVIFSFFEDSEDNLWVAAKDGLYRLNPKRFKSITTKQGLSHNNVMSILDDKTGGMWVGTWGGSLNRIHQGVVSNYGGISATGLRSDLILGLCDAPDGSFWIGTDYDHGLFQLKNGKYRRFGQEHRFPCHALRVVYSDSKTNLWIGNTSGLSRFDGKKFVNFSATNGLSVGRVRVLMEDGEGRLWIGGDGGLLVREKEQFIPFPSHDPIRKTVNALYEDADKTVWIGTLGSGLFRWRGGRLTSYSTRQGLYDHDVFDIVEDRQQRLWMTSLKGIFQIAKHEIDEFNNGRLRRLNCLSFHTSDGITHLQCNGVAKPGAIHRQDGTLAFATTKGVMVLDPKSDLVKNLRPPSVVIESLLAGQNTFFSSAGPTNGQVIRIPPGRGDLEFRYTALSLRAPERNRFKYRVDKVDEDWIDSGSQRAAHYNNLPAGQYTFSVIACNDDEVWNEAGAVLAFVILPNFWETWWFKWAMGASVGGLVFFAYRVRVARIRAFEQLRLQIAADLHDDVGSHLTKISMLMEAANREAAETPRTRSLVQEAMVTSREVMLAMDEIVWTIKPKNDTVENLANYIFRYAQRYCRNSSLRSTFDIPPILPNDPISTDVRHNLFLAFKEALQNAVKHSGATEAKVTLTYSNKTLALFLADNGSGFSMTEAVNKGNGLSNMQSRLEQVHGQLMIETAPGKGTRIEFRVTL